MDYYLCDDVDVNALGACAARSRTPARMNDGCVVDCGGYWEIIIINKLCSTF